MPFKSKFCLKAVSIRRDQQRWLEKQYSLNFSGFVQEKIDELIEQKKDPNFVMKKYRDTKAPTT